MESAANLSSTATSGSYLNTDRQIFELKSQNQALVEQMNKVVGTVNELIKASNVKYERQQSLMARLEQSHNGLAVETGQKLSQLSNKVNERKALEMKVQEMVDRHNNVIKSFEVRMNHLQKLLAEKEGQMAAAQTALNDAKMEIARLKRF
jgi:chromosome segregation ATPase